VPEGVTTYEVPGRKAAHKLLQVLGEALVRDGGCAPSPGEHLLVVRVAHANTTQGPVLSPRAASRISRRVTPRFSRERIVTPGRNSWKR